MLILKGMLRHSNDNMTQKLIIKITKYYAVLALLCNTICNKIDIITYTYL